MADATATETHEINLPPVKRLSREELDRISLRRWEAGKAEVSAYWRKRFLDKQLERQRQTQPAE